jgi:hypothetical protein
MPRVTQRGAYGGYYSKTTYKSTNNSPFESAEEYQERMRRRFQQQQYTQQQQPGRDAQDDARRQVFEEVLRQQRAYEEKMRSDWFASKENLYDLQEELMQHRAEMAKRKLFAFFATIIGMWMVFSLIFKIYSGPQEVVVVDPTTGRRRVMSISEFDELERQAYMRQLEIKAGREPYTRSSNSRTASDQSGQSTVFGQRNPYESYPEYRSSR